VNKKYVVGGILIALTVLILVFTTSGGEKETLLEARVNRGQFDVIITVTGELQAQNSEKIMAPSQLRSRRLRFNNIKIQDLIPEGTVVDSGDYVATLDRSEAANTLKDIEDEVQKIESQYLKTKLDTTINLRELRDALINLEFAMEEAEIRLEQSKFEPPATIRQAKIDLDKADRAYEQARSNYKLKVQQAEADMTEVNINLSKENRRMEEMLEVLDQFVIMAPKPGMVIYHREWSGQKRKVGSTISPWDLTVATLPDLSTMVSKTYINEIDISKVKRGQQVEIGVDAFPEKKYSGTITEVANIGEQLPNTDAKVFEVVIKIEGYDPILRPSMTTSNQILINTFSDVTFIPIEAVHTFDSIPFVFTSKGTRQIVLLDEANENQIIVEKGLEEGDKIYLNAPEEGENWKLQGEDLLSLIEEKKRLEEEKKKKEEEEQNAPDRNKAGKKLPLRK